MNDEAMFKEIARGNNNVSAWSSAFRDRPDKTSPNSSETSPNASSRSVSRSANTGVSSVSNEVLRAADELVLGLVSENVDTVSVKGLLSKIDELVEAANPSDERSIAASKKELDRKLSASADERFMGAMLMIAGVEGAVNTYERASQDYNTLSSVRQKLTDNPEAYTAFKKAEMYAALSNYVQAAGYAIGFEKQSIANNITAVANIFSAHAQQGLNAFNQSMSLSEQGLRQQQYTSNEERNKQQEITNTYQKLATFVPEGHLGRLYVLVSNAGLSGSPQDQQALQEFIAPFVQDPYVVKGGR